LEAIKKMKGTVKWFNEGKGYGFVEGEDEKEYFVHISALGEGVSLREGDSVNFEPSKTDRGLQATNVTLE
jgi:cold shock protein